MHHGALITRAVRGFLLSAPLLLAACGGSALVAPVEPATVADDVIVVGSTPRADPLPQPPTPLLDVAIVVFERGDAAAARVPVRAAEARLLPLLLRRAVMDTGAFGVVRVVPDPDFSAAVTVRGSVEQSDGRDLQLAIEASDASGAVWFRQRYRDRATAEDYPVQPPSDPFDDLYRRVAADLAAAAVALDRPMREELQALARLDFARTLSPEAFSGYLVEGDGRLRLRALPADDDPMWLRVQRLQRQEALFVDVADEQYGDMLDRFRPVYDLWRGSSRELLSYQEAYLERVAARDNPERPGTFPAMRRSYDVYRVARMQEQDLEDMAEGFDNEVTDQLVAMDDRVVRLRGSLKERYREWRELLREIFRLEVGQSASTP